MDIASKFVEWEVPLLASLESSKVYQLREKLNRGEKLERSEKNWLTEAVNRNAYFKQSVPLQGWKFSFADALHHYWVKQYGQIAEYFAVDKTALRSIYYREVRAMLNISAVSMINNRVMNTIKCLTMIVKLYSSDEYFEFITNLDMTAIQETF